MATKTPSPSKASDFQSNTSKSELQQPTPDDFFNFELVSFQVENRIFRVLKNGFNTPGSIFEATFSLPLGNGEAEGSSNENPIHLKGIRESHFRAFLRQLYMFNNQPPVVEYDDWVGVLKLSTMWDVRSIRAKAIKALTVLLPNKGLLERIDLGRQYKVSRWIQESYIELVRKKSLELRELTEPPWALDWETIAKIFYIRDTQHVDAAYNCPICFMQHGKGPGPCQKGHQAPSQDITVTEEFSRVLVDEAFRKELEATQEVVSHNRNPPLPASPKYSTKVGTVPWILDYSPSHTMSSETDEFVPVEEERSATPSVTSPEPDHLFNFELVSFQAGNKVFRVLTHGLNVPGTIFEAMLSLPAAENGEGSSNENPIHLNGVEENHFRSFLCVLYSEIGDLPAVVKYDDWIGVLNLATMWEFRKIRAKAITALSTLLPNKPILEKINLGRTFRVADWIREAFVELVRKRPLDLEELRETSFSLDWETISRIFYIRDLQWDPVFSCPYCDGQHGRGFGTCPSGYSSPPSTMPPKERSCELVDKVFREELEAAREPIAQLNTDPPLPSGGTPLPAPSTALKKKKKKKM